MKTKRHVVSIVLTLVVLGALAGFVAVNGYEPKLGLDLQGGLSVTLTAPSGTRSDVLEKTIEILRRRIDAAGVAEPEISREGTNNILVQLPGTTEQRRLLELIGQTAQLQFRQVLEIIPAGDPSFATSTVTGADDAQAEVIVEARGEESKLRLGPAVLTGDAVRRGSAVVDPTNGSWSVSLKLNRAGERAWEEFTGKLACEPPGDPKRQIAIVLDEQVESHPQVAEEVQCNDGITGDTQISGEFTQEEAKDLALVLTTGALPVELEQSEVRSVSPTLGRDSLRAGLLAGALGLALVFLYVLVYYRSLGLQTWIGLIAFSGLVYLLVVIFGELIGWSLTLAGIAGMIVSIGVATDSYIVFFERVKEEVHAGRSLRSAIDRGFVHAWRTMRTANAVTILAAIVLYLVAVGAVRGFALALGLATILDLMITYTLTWPFAALLARSSFFTENRLLGMRRALEGSGKGFMKKIYQSDFNIDFVGKRRTWLMISAGLIIFSVLMMIPGIRGLQSGIDFRGGTLIRAPIERNVGVAQITSSMSEAGLEKPIVQIVEDISGRRQAQVQSDELKGEDLNRATTALAQVTGADESEVDTEAVGEKWGAQVTARALRGLGIFLVLVILYMSWRLEPKMAAAGIGALLHDLVVTAGIYAAVGFEVSPATVVALLTILGFSLYDTVVIFDKIRENQAAPANARKTFAEIANASSNQVFMRSINTSLTVLLPVGSLLFIGSVLLGADTLKDLALALFIGLAASTYSSIYVAVPLLSLWKEREPRYLSVRARVLRGADQARGKDGDGALPDLRPARATAGGTVSSGTASSRAAPSGSGSTQRGTGGAKAPRKKQSRSKRKKTRR